MVVKLENGKIPATYDLSHVVEIALVGDLLYCMEVGASSKTEFGLAYLNHSCQANIGFRDRIVLYALNDIAADSVLTIDYRQWDWVHEGIKCWCPDAKCEI
ncbi:MAG: SET domain-containing protein-lysine N-methyltransferase [Candidatus Pacebacteria bacterium]|nr:SET domain-containing protein-lysine N-methyltransferase [Candidatus Paceibacterota bacterium]